MLLLKKVLLHYYVCTYVYHAYMHENCSGTKWGENVMKTSILAAEEEEAGQVEWLWSYLLHMHTP